MKVNSHKLDEADFPAKLKQLYDPPNIIYWAGANPNSWIGKPALGVVGSRNPTPYGRQVTQKLTIEAARGGAVIISGLAFGIDSAAHQAALSGGGITVAVLPGPINQIYPASHRSLAAEVIKRGGTLISEYAAGALIRKENFIARNRLIAALADALLVPQAARHSGSLHTANFALEQGKTVMAVPGEINIEMNHGSNNLLKTGAVMVTSADDIFDNLGLKRTAPKKRPVKVSAAQQLLFDLIGSGISEPEDLATATQMSSPQLSSALSLLEIDGYIKASSGRWVVN